MYASKVIFTNSYAMESFRQLLYYKIFLKQKAEISMQVALVLPLAKEQIDAKQTRMTKLSTSRFAERSKKNRWYQDSPSVYSWKHLCTCLHQTVQVFLCTELLLALVF